MINSGVGHKPRWFKIAPLAVCITTLVVFFYVGVAVGASGEEPAAKGWVHTDTFRIINFGVLLVGLVYLLRKPISQALNDRIKGIQDQLTELEDRKNEAERQLAEYNQKFLQLDKEAEKIITEYVKQGNEAKTRIIQEAEAAVKKLEEQARRNIEQEFEKTKQILRGEVLVQALEKAEENIKKKITKKDQNRLVDEYLDKVVA
jgi:F-type H+-transporting ATPase subunit b